MIEFQFLYIRMEQRSIHTSVYFISQSTTKSNQKPSEYNRIEKKDGSSLIASFYGWFIILEDHINPVTSLCHLLQDYGTK